MTNGAYANILEAYVTTKIIINFFIDIKKYHIRI